MTRYRLTIEYDGGPFVGWQRQENGSSVQGTLEAAIFRLSGEKTDVQGAGRTDAGVHAIGQVAHIDIVKDFAPEKIRDGLNFYLRPDPISVLSATVVAADFHARFDATSRHYRYQICNRRAPLVLEAGRAWWVARTLDADLMHEAGQYLIGHHDFTSFRAAICQAASPAKTLDRLEVRREGDMIAIEVDARSFLHHQVRNIVGTLEMVGAGKWQPRKVRDILLARDRAKAGPTAPPHGLYLVGVGY